MKSAVLAGSLAMAATVGFGVGKWSDDTAAAITSGAMGSGMTVDLMSVEEVAAPVVMDVQDVQIGTVTRVSLDPSQVLTVAPGTSYRAPVSPAPLIELVQRSTGTTCQTSQGVCTVAPKPISASCSCGRYSGKITG